MVEYGGHRRWSAKQCAKKLSELGVGIEETHSIVPEAPCSPPCSWGADPNIFSSRVNELSIPSIFNQVQCRQPDEGHSIIAPASNAVRTPSSTTIAHVPQGSFPLPSASNSCSVAGTDYAFEDLHGWGNRLMPEHASQVPYQLSTSVQAFNNQPQCQSPRFCHDGSSDIDYTQGFRSKLPDRSTD